MPAALDHDLAGGRHVALRTAQHPPQSLAFHLDGLGIHISSSHLLGQHIPLQLHHTLVQLLLERLELAEDFRPASRESTGQHGTTVVAFFNEFAAAAHAAGKKYHAYTPALWYDFTNVFLSGLTGPDAIILVNPVDDPGEDFWHTRLNEFFTHAQRPVLYNPIPRGGAGGIAGARPIPAPAAAAHGDDGAAA